MESVKDEVMEAEDLWLTEWSEPSDVKSEIKLEDVDGIKIEEESRQGADVARLHQIYGSKLAASTGREEDFAKYAEIVHSAEIRYRTARYSCVFRCPKCPFENPGVDGLYSHFKATKHQDMRFSVYSAIRYLVKAFAYVCKLCGQKMLHESKTVLRHINSHGLKIADFRRRFEPLGELLAKSLWQKNLPKEDPIVTQYRRIVETAEVSDDLNKRCILACTKCDYKTNCLSNLRRHFKRTEHESKSLSKYEMLYLLERNVSHVCKLCRQKMLCESSSLSNHFQLRHNITLLQYQKKFNILGLSAERKIKQVALLNKIISDATECLEVRNKCLFTCFVCLNQVSSFNCLRDHHIKRKHPDLTLSKWEVPIIIKEAYFHQCKICKEKLLCDLSFISDHLREKHKYSMVKYKEQYLDVIVPAKKIISKKELQDESTKLEQVLSSAKTVSDKTYGLCLFYCKVCSFTTKNSTSLRTHFKEKSHGPSMVSKHNITSHLKKAVAHVCKLCSQRILADSAFVCQHVFFSHNMNISDYRKILYNQQGERKADDKQPVLFDHIGNKCRFKCRACPQSFSSWLHMQKHIKSTGHGSLGELGLALRLAQDVAWHDCVLCGKRLLCDNYLATWHMRNKHSCSLGAYHRAKLEMGNREMISET